MASIIPLSVQRLFFAVISTHITHSTSGPKTLALPLLIRLEHRNRRGQLPTPYPSWWSSVIERRPRSEASDMPHVHM